LGSDKFEAIIEELGQIAQSTPYLLMQHDLCQLTFSALSRLKALSKEAALPTMLFRARATTKPVASEVTEFGFPPAYVVGQGRYNHAGIPVLYLGSTRETCIAELRDASCKIAGFRMDATLHLLDLTAEYSDAGEDGELLNTLVFSALLSAKSKDDGASRPEYVFTRFLADCAKAVGFQAIKYPSTRPTERACTRPSSGPRYERLGVKH